MTRHLFIGGPADGEWREVDRDVELWRVEAPPSVEFVTRPAPIEYTMRREEHYYFRRQWRDEDAHKLHTFYVHQDLGIKDVFTLLVQGYRRPHVPKVEA